MKRFVMIGTGGFAKTWCATNLPPLIAAGRIQCVAAADVNPHNLRNADGLGVPADRRFTNASDALAVDADFAIVVVPPRFKEAIVAEALGRGLDVLSEKPLAGDLPATVRLANQIASTGRKVAVTMSHRFDADKQTLLQAVRSGKWGDPHYAVMRRTVNARWHDAAGNPRYHATPDLMLVEGGVHAFDYLRVISDAAPGWVFATSWSPPWAEYEGDVSALVCGASSEGFRWSYEFSYANAATLNEWSKEYVRIECEHATLVLDQRHLVARWTSRTGETSEEAIPMLQRPTWANAWLAEQWVDWLEGGTPMETTIDDHLPTSAITFGAVESAHTRSVVDVAAFLANAQA